MKKSTSKSFVRKAMLGFALFIASSAIAFSQIKVSGTITDSNKDPLIGVNIMVSGLKSGTISDFNGKYSIQVPSNKATLIFSYIGYKTVIREVGNSTSINVSLEEDTKVMDEVVVVAYGAQKKSQLTSAISSIKNEKLDEVPVSRVDQALQGKLAGVQILNTNPEAGAAPVIRVRGMGSISAANDPLIVVDGFPVPDGLSMVSMGDVESIEVLKDAASASLYGSRAAGGVILVTTKSGNISKPKFSFKMYSGVRTTLKLPDMLTFDDYIGLLYSEAELRKIDPAIDGTTSTIIFNKITDPERGSYLIEHNFLDTPTDWMREGLRQYGTNQNYQLSAAGGDKNIKYFISGAYNNELGVMKNSSIDKYTFRAKVDVKISKSVTLGINIAPSFSRKETPGTDLTNYIRFMSWLPIRHNAATAALTGRIVGEYAQPSDFATLSLSGTGYNNEIWNLQNTSVSSSTVMNPVSQRERTSIFTDDYRSQNNAYLTIDIMKGLQFKTSNGAYISYKEYNKKEQTSASGAGNPNKLTRQTTLHTELLSENTLTYNLKNSIHELQVLAGMTIQKASDKFNQLVGTGFPDEQMLSYNLAKEFLLDSPTIPGMTSYYYSESLVSFLGRINYAFDGKYLASLSLRSDGSSKFAEGHKWGTFPAGTVGWRVSEEKFMKKMEWLTNLKLRASYGLTGNNSIPQYSYMNSINLSNYYTGTGASVTSGMSANGTSLGNNDITWEQTAEANYGLDLGLFKNRLNVSVEYYNSNTIQLLLQMPAMYITGHQNYWNNIGKVKNEGFELELTITNVDRKNFTWKTTANISTNKNTLLNYGEKLKEDNTGERGEVYRAIVGQPSIQFFGYKSDGVYTTLEEMAAAKAIFDPITGASFNYTTYSPALGGLKVLNTNGDNKLDADDRVVLGSPFPDFTWGITNTLTFKNFDLTVLIQGVQGGKVINGNLYYPEQIRYNKAYTANRYVSPMFPGDGKTVYSTNTTGTDLMLTDYCLEDASYAALRDFSLGYKLPSKISKKLMLNSVRAYFSAQNLVYLMSSNYRGINPEARRMSGSVDSPLKDGYQRGAFPLNRTFTAGIDINF